MIEIIFAGLQRPPVMPVAEEREGQLLRITSLCRSIPDTPQREVPCGISTKTFSGRWPRYGRLICESSQAAPAAQCGDQQAAPEIPAAACRFIPSPTDRRGRVAALLQVIAQQHRCGHVVNRPSLLRFTADRVSATVRSRLPARQPLVHAIPLRCPWLSPGAERTPPPLSAISPASPVMCSGWPTSMRHTPFRRQISRNRLMSFCRFVRASSSVAAPSSPSHPISPGRSFSDHSPPPVSSEVFPRFVHLPGFCRSGSSGSTYLLIIRMAASTRNPGSARKFSLDHAHKLDKSTRIVVTACGRARRFPTPARILRSSSSGPGRFPSATARSGRATGASQSFRSCRQAHTR